MWVIQHCFLSSSLGFLAIIFVCCFSDGVLCASSVELQLPTAEAVDARQFASKYYSSTESRILKTIGIVAVGTRGDIQPYVAVGLALKKKGYGVLIVTSKKYVSMITDLGLIAYGAYDDPAEIMRADSILLDRMARGRTESIMMSFREVFSRLAPTVAPAIMQAYTVHKPDLILTTTWGEFGGWYVAHEYGTPYMRVDLFSLLYNPKHMQFGYPTLPFGLHYYSLKYIVLGLSYYMALPFDRSTKKGVMDKFSRQDYAESTLHPVRPIMLLISPIFGHVLAPNASHAYKFVGTTVVGAEHQVDKAEFGGVGNTRQLQDFIDAGTQPIYIGWGSMIGKSRGFMADLAVSAARRAGKRAIVLGGFAQVSFQALQEYPGVTEDLLNYARMNVLFVDTAPHEWLFPRVACTIHHGGAGTTAAAVRAGVPTIITPVLFDQFDYSYVVRELGIGVGFEKRLVTLSGDVLGDAIIRVVGDESIIQKAKEIGARLTAETGADEAVRQIELFWDEYCISGKFHAVFLKGSNNRQSDLLLWLLLAGAGVVFARMWVLGRRRPLRKRTHID
jgi:sterol 3beta-glucosyltransferase